MMNQIKWLVTNNINNNEERKTIRFSNYSKYRAIRTRTVDLLGKTDQTYYYQNNLNCFKDPTCIFLHWALSLTVINKLVYHIFSWQKVKGDGSMCSDSLF